MNELLFFISLIIVFSFLLLSYYKFGKTGLFAYIAFATVFANIIVIKCVDLFTLSITLGNVLFGGVSLATDMLNENHGENEARKSVNISFYILILFTILSQIVLMFIPNSSDIAQNALYQVFSLSPRICIASIIAYFISTNLNIYCFDKIKSILPQDKFLWVRNNVSTIVSQFIDCAIFTTCAFAYIFPFKTLISIIFTTWIIKILVALLDTPFIYLSQKIAKKLTK